MPIKQQKIGIVREQHSWNEASYKMVTENIAEDEPEAIGIILAEALWNFLSDVRKNLQNEDKQLYNDYVVMLLDHIKQNLLQ